MDFKRQEIIFPVAWSYRTVVISKYEPKVINDLQALIYTFGVKDKLRLTNTSSSGTFKTYIFTKLLNSHQEMEDIAVKISEIEGVKLVI